jgi:hypothetical protein
MNSGTPSARASTCSTTASGSALSLGDAGNDAGAVATAEAAQGQHRHMRAADPGRLNSGRNVTTSSIGMVAARAINRSSRSSDVGSIQWMSSNRIRTGTPRRGAADLVEQRRESHLPLLLRADRYRRIAIVRRHPQQFGDQRHVARQIFCRRLEQGLQFVEPGAGVVARLKNPRPARSA